MNRHNKYLLRKKAQRFYKNFKTSIIAEAVHQACRIHLDAMAAIQRLRVPIPKYPEGGPLNGKLAVVGEGNRREIIKAGELSFIVPEATLMGLDIAKQYSDVSAIAEIYGYPEKLLGSNLSSMSQKRINEAALVFDPIYPIDRSEYFKGKVEEFLFWRHLKK